MRTLGPQNVNGRSQNETDGSVLRATQRKKMIFWTPLWLVMKHGFFTTLLTPSNSHCNGAIRIPPIGPTPPPNSPKRIPPEPKNSKLQFQWKKNGFRFLGQKRHSPGRHHASWPNNYRRCILWHLDTVSTNHSKQKERNVVTRRVPGPGQRAVHSAQVTTALLEKFQWDILHHPP